jgi:pimeloyl-ACP methyl ester carboxylesterase
MSRDIDVARGNGRSVRVRLAGAPDGPLVIYIHGSPSSRLDVDFLDTRSARRDVRVAGIDRPGYGGSTYQRFDFTSVAADAVAVADYLGVHEFAVMGQSAGVGYALATAATHPDRVTAVATAGGGAPYEPGTKYWDSLSAGEQRGAALVGIDDDEAERLLAEEDKRYVELLDLDDAGLEAAWSDLMVPADQRALETNGWGQLFVASVRESLRQGQAGWARDNVVRIARWDFDVTAIRCPATFWLGEQDIPALEGGEWLAARIPHGTLRVLPDHGHMVAVERWDDVLDSLGV